MKLLTKYLHKYTVVCSIEQLMFKKYFKKQNIVLSNGNMRNTFNNLNNKILNDFLQTKIYLQIDSLKKSNGISHKISLFGLIKIFCYCFKLKLLNIFMNM